MIPQKDSVWPYAKDYIQNIPDKKFSPNKAQRTPLYAWLATTKEPSTGMGSGINIGDLKVDGSLCNTFEVWLNKLFGQIQGTPDPLDLPDDTKHTIFNPFSSVLVALSPIKQEHQCDGR